ncbi:ABC transporter permease [Mesorhizobium sp. RP14(2022)]|uniref:ABC transporter permease n=1 Tax=Mesorhizobium liriopis TaxID=2953882 RepID=A0ABT1CBH0_9HYPH|nr:ABC transporter permease [Mesorhizobium liriopis]MCO6051818.1 ABC transporter permease [Mesorhizobium liriopis]
MALATAKDARTPGLLSARLALRWLIAGEWRAHPARFLATAIAIAVGVALGFAVHLVNGSALASFEGAVRGVNGAADLAVRATSPLGFTENLYPSVATTEGVADASPVVSLEGEANGARFSLLGLDVIRAASVTPSLVGLRPQGPDTENDAVFAETVFLSDAALAATGAKIGDRILVSANGQSHPFQLAGSLPGAGGEQALGVVDIAAAQWRFDRLGRLDRIDLKLTDRTAAEEALNTILPADAVLGSAETEAAQGSALSRAYRVNLDMLALVALLTGGFLVFSAQSLSVARRLRAFALVRTLGLPRGGIIAAVALEGLFIGLIGASLGLLLGYGLASAALRFFGGDLGAGYFSGAGNRVVFQPVAAFVFFLLGLLAALGGSILPARAAARAAPAAALKNSGDMLDPRAPVPWLPALVLVGAGALVSLAPALDGLPVLGFVGMALLLAGGVAGVPWLARKLLGGLVRLPGQSVPRLLAVRHIHGAPGEAATALCGIVASTALMIAMAIMVTSFRTAVDEWLGQVLSADLYLRTAGGPALDPDAQNRLANVAGVGRIAFSRQLPLTIQPDRPPVTLIARPLDASRSDPLLVLIERGDDLPAGAIPVYVSEPASRIYNWQPGDTIALPLGGSGNRFAVAGIWRDYARQAGAVVIDSADYSRLTGDATRDEAMVRLAPDARFEAVADGLRAVLPPTARQSAEVTEPAALRRFALDLFDRSFAVTYLLEAVAILVGLAGVAATVSAQVIARVREFGMLRHLGLSKTQVIAMLGTEGALLGLVGGVAGVLLGAVLSQVLIHVINPQSFNWTMDTHVPWGTVVGVIMALIAAAALTAMIAGRRATAQSAVLAVREDW